MFAPVYSQPGPDPGLAKYNQKKGNYPEAIKIYNQVLKFEPDEADHHYNLGICYLSSEMSPEKALFHLNIAYNKSKSKKDILYYLAIAHLYHQNYDQAKKYFTEYSSGMAKSGLKKDAKRMIESCDTAQYLFNNPSDVEIINLGENINTPDPDYYPFYFEKDSTLFFSSRRPKKGTTLEFDGLYQADIYYSIDTENGFHKARELDKVNTKLDEQLAGITSDKKLYVYIDHIENFGNIIEYEPRGPNIFRRNKEFTVLSNLKEIATTVFFSRDGEKMYYTSNNKEGKGGYDIFVRTKTGENIWSEPESININTPYDEGFPFLSTDEKTLYFCSNGLPGMGGFDLYKSEWNEDTKTWGTPINLGYPINTAADEKFIWFLSDMKTAYISGYRKEGYGYTDIYKVIFK